MAEKKTKTNTDFNRPPIVVVLGHVDHGKTSLLDAIRKTRVALKEAGGITQSIGASVVTTKSGKKITFIDTPGHAAFSKMRGRGAKVADIAILVVAADDGVAPQTKEVIAHIQEAGIPFIVALTKVDLATANVESTLAQLEKEGLLLEKRGGDIPWLKVSAKTGQGLEELLNLISLLAEMSEIQGNPGANLEAVVIETTKDKRGSMVNAVVRNGSLKVGDLVYTPETSGKVRGLFNEEGVVKVVLPGEPVQIMGFEELPGVGSPIATFSFEKEKTSGRDNKVVIGEDQLGIILKAQNKGSLEAILAGLPQEVVVVESGVGDIYESDVLLAKGAGGKIFTFEAKVSPNVQKLADTEGVKIYSFRIIYELFDTLAEMIKKGQSQTIGKAEIIASFPFNNKRIAGCRMVMGKIGKSDHLLLLRGQKEIGKLKAISLKKQKTEVNEVKQGEEFGLLFEPQLDFAEGDMILSVVNG